jgi:hypothetical protein
MNGAWVGTIRQKVNSELDIVDQAGLQQGRIVNDLPGGNWHKNLELAAGQVLSRCCAGWPLSHQILAYLAGSTVFEFCSIT